MARRYNPPPNWPQPPAGWTPPPGWQPDPSWGPPPPGWQLWETDGASSKKLVIGGLILGFLLLGGCAAVGVGVLVARSGGSSDSSSVAAPIPSTPDTPDATTEQPPAQGPSEPPEPTASVMSTAPGSAAGTQPQPATGLSAGDQAICADVATQVGSMGRVLIGLGSGTTTSAEAGVALNKTARRMQAASSHAQSSRLRTSLSASAAALSRLRTALVSGGTTGLQTSSVTATAKLRDFQHACGG